MPCSVNCTDTAFEHDAGDELAMVQETRGHIYGPGGYRVSLESSLWLARDELQRLKRDSWLDEKTRAVNVEASIENLLFVNRRRQV